MWNEFRAIVHVSRRKFGKMSSCDAALVESWLSSPDLTVAFHRLFTFPTLPHAIKRGYCFHSSKRALKSCVRKE